MYFHVFVTRMKIIKAYLMRYQFSRSGCLQDNSQMFCTYTYIH